MSEWPQRRRILVRNRISSLCLAFYLYSDVSTVLYYAFYEAWVLTSIFAPSVSCRLRRQKGNAMKKNLVAKNEYGMYADNKGIARVDSLTVAEVFDKRHDNVIRDIRQLDCSEEFRLLNFDESTYINACVR